MSTQQLQRQEPPATLKSMLKDSIYQKRFEEILGKRAPQFVSSVLSVGISLGHDCEPTSIIASAMTAATLDLPVDKNLGFAWIVPYKNNGKKSAQFQMGYKGYIQLGLRTGQYERMNARVVNEEAFQGWDEVGEPIINWSQIDESKPAFGYVFAFKLVNGFTKIAFWPKARVEAHAKRYSKSYGGNYSSPWSSNFDEMALKTVVKNELAKWGILSIEMVTAIKHDQGTQDDVGSDPTYLDGANLENGNDQPDVPEVINEEQRVALVSAAKTSGQDLSAIVTTFGFGMLADITVEQYEAVLAAVSAPVQKEEPKAEEPKSEDAAAEEVDPIEWLRANVRAALDELPATKRKNLIAGKPMIGEMTEEELRQMLADATA